MTEPLEQKVFFDHDPVGELLSAYLSYINQETAALIVLPDTDDFLLWPKKMVPITEIGLLFGNTITPPPPITITIPNIVGQTSFIASLMIVAAGAAVGVVTPEYSSTVAVGLVIAQDPVSGFTGQPPIFVNYVLSLGPYVPPTPTGTPIPNLRGLTQAQAQALLAALGFGVGKSTSLYD